jgi:sugar-specific transcriptional regulator TrmB
LIQEEAQRLFTSLGFTSLQAKVYITVLSSGEATAKSIAANARIDRPDTYRVIDSLVKQGFIEKEIDNPIRFKALPIDEVTEILLKRKQEEVTESSRQASEILRRYEHKTPKTETDEPESYFYNLLPGNKHVIDKASNKIIEASQKSLDFLCANIYPPIIGLESLEGFLSRGGTNRILAYNRNDALAGKVLNSHKKGSIEIRYVSKSSGSPMVALIGDMKQALVICKRGRTPEERESLFTNSPVIAELAANYFESLWNCAEKFS